MKKDLVEAAVKQAQEEAKGLVIHSFGMRHKGKEEDSIVAIVIASGGHRKIEEK